MKREIERKRGLPPIITTKSSRSPVLFFLLSIVITTTVHAEVYKCVKQGKTTYSDNRCEDFKKKINPGANAGTEDDTYEIEDNNYVNDGAETNAPDLINGTAGKDAIYGLGGDDYLNGKEGEDYIEGGNGGDYIQGGMGKDTINGGAGDDYIYGSSDVDIGMPTDVNFTKPVNEWTHAQATGFNWTAGYNAGDLYSNGTPIGYTQPTPRNRLADDQSNLIDGGAGNDFIAADTGADYVHGGADKDLIWGMDKDDILDVLAANDMVYNNNNERKSA